MAFRHDGGVSNRADVPSPTGASAARGRAEELGELVNGQPNDVPAALPELGALLADAGDDVGATRAAVVALWFASEYRALRLLLTGHPDPQVRLALARALGGGLPAPDVRAGAIAGLLRLSADATAEVRNWACFGLGRRYADSPDVREPLAARLDDPDSDTRDEALAALATTGDARALARTGQVLAGPDEGGVRLLHLQAAVELAAPELLPVLRELEQEWAGDEDEHTLRLARALRRSTMTAAQRAGELERQLVDRVNEHLASEERAMYATGRYPRTTLHFRNEPAASGWWRRLWDDDDPDTLNLSVEVASWVNDAP